MSKYNQFLKVKFDIPKDLEARFKMLEEKIHKHIVRQAIRSAVIPMRQDLHAKLAALDTPQTSGASMRAVGTRVSQSKRNPYRFYGIVGVKRNFFEVIFPEEETKLAKLDKTLGVRQISMGSMWFDKQGRLRKAKRPGVREVQSKLKVKSGPRIRRPSKYWHLLLYGFGPNINKGKKAGKTRKPFSGYRFLEKIRDANRAEVRRIFVTRFRELMKQAVK